MCFQSSGQRALLALEEGRSLLRGLERGPSEYFCQPLCILASRSLDVRTKSCFRVFFCLWPSGFGRPGIAVNMAAPGCQFSEIDHGSPPTLESFWNVSNMPLAWQRALQGVGYLWKRAEGEGQ